MLSKHKVSTVNSVLGFSLCAIISVFVLTKAPQSIAQRPVFDDVYDANAPVLLRGTITEIEQFEEYSLIYIDSNNVDGESESWVVEGGSAQNMEEHGLNQSVIGRSVIVRGYQSIDKSCNPYCKMNGRDLEFIDS